MHATRDLVTNLQVGHLRVSTKIADNQMPLTQESLNRYTQQLIMAKNSPVGKEMAANKEGFIHATVSAG